MSSSHHPPLPACLSNRAEILIGTLYLKKDSSNSIRALMNPNSPERTSPINIGIMQGHKCPQATIPLARVPRQSCGNFNRNAVPEEGFPNSIRALMNPNSPERVRLFSGPFILQLLDGRGSCSMLEIIYCLL
ncbi:hypothetical protein CDAR_276071 [Caerostris darwini]|uniref:Uncharacterized protein n=1 Tax=Caerostris darwini TaxID=1538125 RepID=A0AAV4QP61_9ARAC|nr:hypothetical protein CDAR_276071 [Caerostris darwini]